ncbi:hypothetical protein ACLEDZ_00360 [Lonsdalea quercina]|uniref:hypothetical protein n=1 Tax=Lonsdalea quercina TaxID=71657 RepID=UPI003975CAE0
MAKLVLLFVITQEAAPISIKEVFLKSVFMGGSSLVEDLIYIHGFLFSKVACLSLDLFPIDNCIEV